MLVVKNTLLKIKYLVEVILLLLPFIILSITSKAEDGKLSTTKSVATVEIKITIPPRIYITPAPTPIVSSNLNMEEWDVEKRGNIYIFLPKL